MDVVVFKQTTGEITFSGTVDSMRNVAAQLETPDYSFLLDVRANEDEKMVQDGAVVDRPALFDPDAFSIDEGESLLLPVPLETFVVAHGQQAIVMDGEIEYVGLIAGDDVIVVQPPFPYKPQTLKVTINEIPAA